MIARGRPSLIALALAAGCALGRSPQAPMFIHVTMNARSQVRDGMLDLTLNVSQAGNDTAYAVVPTLEGDGQRTVGERRERVRPGESYATRLRLPVRVDRSGTWPWKVTLDFKDGNGYPFQAIHAGTFESGTPPPHRLSVLTVPAPSAQPAIAFAVRNDASTACAVELGAYMPTDLALGEPMPALRLAPGERREVSVPVVNRTAIRGGRYSLYVVAEYDQQGAHDTILVQTTTAVGPEGR